MFYECAEIVIIGAAYRLKPTKYVYLPSVLVLQAADEYHHGIADDSKELTEEHLASFFEHFNNKRYSGAYLASVGPDGFFTLLKGEIWDPKQSK